MFGVAGSFSVFAKGVQWGGKKQKFLWMYQPRRFWKKLLEKTFRKNLWKKSLEVKFQTFLAMSSACPVFVALNTDINNTSALVRWCGTCRGAGAGQRGARTCLVCLQL